MNTNREGLLRKRSLTGQFLFSKTSSKHEDDKPTSLPDDFDELVKAFPDIKSQDSFVDQSIAGLKSTPTFGAMVISVDKLKRKKRMYPERKIRIIYGLRLPEQFSGYVKQKMECGECLIVIFSGVFFLKKINRSVSSLRKNLKENLPKKEMKPLRLESPCIRH